ncbi:MAG TPA: hypothetical protein VD884_08130 [Ohtaekwangia sp.]|nr:hypothetical protein [Ohtaekwangia sp.]
MKKLYCLFGVLILFSTSVSAQDEGTIVKRERLARANNIFLGIGPSFTFGKNIGDYSLGFNGEVGFLKRMNRVLSIGPSISYLSFDYDPEKTGFKNVFIGGPYVDQWGDSYYGGMRVDLKGGNLAITSLAFTAKINFVPVKDNTKFSVYGFVKPFISVVSRSEVTGLAYVYTNYGDPEDPQDWEDTGAVVELDPEDSDFEVSDKLKEGTEVTGGIFIGPGVEYNPGKNISFFAQASFGYTFPVTFVSSEKYEGFELEDVNEEYPMTKEGFPSINIQLGISFNF